MSRQMRRAPRYLSLAVALLWPTILGATSSARPSAAEVVGRLTLPFAARLGEALLPAGEYSFALDYLGRPRLLRIRGGADSLVVPAVAAGDYGREAVLDQSALIAVRHRGTHTVRALCLVTEGHRLTLSFPSPEGRPERGLRMPALLQRVSIQLLER